MSYNTPPHTGLQTLLFLTLQHGLLHETSVSRIVAACRFFPRFVLFKITVFLIIRMAGKFEECLYSRENIVNLVLEKIMLCL